MEKATTTIKQEISECPAKRKNIAIFFRICDSKYAWNKGVFENVEAHYQNMLSSLKL